MDPDEEFLSDRFARQPEALSVEERREAERMVETDAGAARYVGHLREFYALLEESTQKPSAQEISPRVERFVNELYGHEEAPEAGTSEPDEWGPDEGSSGQEPADDRPPATIEARPFRPRREAGPTVLAAATKDERPEAARSETGPAEEASGSFQTFSTLATEGGNVLIRVIGNRETGRGRVYILSDDPERTAWAVVSFPELGLDLVTDEHGIATFDLPEHTAPGEWADVTALLRRPIVEARLHPGEETQLRSDSTAPREGQSTSSGDRTPSTGGPEGTSDSAPTVRCRLNEDRLEAKTQGAGPALVVAWPEGDVAPTLLHLRHGDVATKVPQGEAVLLRAYE